MRIRIYFLALILGISLAGCRIGGVRGNGNVETEVRDVADFTEVELAGEFVVSIEAGKDYFVEIKADDNLLGYISTKVHGNRLVVDTKKNLNPRDEIRVKIQTPHLESIIASGACDIYARDIDEERFDFDMSGACSVELAGVADRVQMEVSGAGSIDARDLRARDVRVYLSGAASADVYATESLDASVSGVGSVNFYGDPSDVNMDVSGVGSINRK